MKNITQRKAGFSLTELLMVVALLLILLSLLAPSLRRGMVLAEQTTCLNNLKQIGLAYALQADDGNGQYAYAMSRVSLGGFTLPRPRLSVEGIDFTA